MIRIKDTIFIMENAKMKKSWVTLKIIKLDGLLNVIVIVKSVNKVLEIALLVLLEW